VSYTKEQIENQIEVLEDYRGSIAATNPTRHAAAMLRQLLAERAGMEDFARAVGVLCGCRAHAYKIGLIDDTDTDCTTLANAAIKHVRETGEHVPDAAGMVTRAEAEALATRTAEIFGGMIMLMKSGQVKTSTHTRAECAEIAAECSSRIESPADSLQFASGRAGTGLRRPPRRRHPHG